MKFTLFFLAVTLAAQTPVARQGANNTFSGTNTFTGVVDAGDATSVKLKRGTTLPPTCTVGQVFFKTDATAGQNFYGCSSTDTWTVQGSASSTLPTLDPLNYLRAAPNTLTYTLEGAPLPVFVTSDYDFPAQTPGGSISIGSNTVTLAPCPLGLNGTDNAHYVYLSAGTGTAEPVRITGGSCTSGSASGTITFTAVNTHSGAWTVTSATAGGQEAISAAPTAGGLVVFPGGSHTMYAGIEVYNKFVSVKGVSRAATRLNFQTGLLGNAIHIVQGGEPYPSISRFEVADMTIVNETMTQPTIHIDGIQAAVNVVHDVYIQGGLNGIQVDGGASDNGFANIVIWDVADTGFSADLTTGGNHQLTNITIGTKGGTQYTYGVHGFITDAGGGVGGLFMLNCGVAATSSLGPTTAMLFENTSGTRTSLFIFMSQVTVDGQFGVDGIVFRHAENANISNSWSVSHTAAAWRFDDALHIQLNGSVAYARAVGSVAIVNGSDHIIITGTSFNTLLSEGTTPAFYFSGTQPTNVVLSGNQIENPSLTNSTTAYLGATTGDQTVSKLRGLFSTGATVNDWVLQNLDAGNPTPIKYLAVDSQGTFQLRNNARSAVIFGADDAGHLFSGTLAFASLGSPPDGALVFCSNCTATNPCAAAGSGAFAQRINGAWACGGSGGGSGTVTSVSFTGGLVSVSNATTTPALTVAGNSGGVPYFSSASTWASSNALGANLPMIGGGTGAAPATGTRSGNTTQFVTTTGTQTNGDCVKIDASGNHIANGSACGGTLPMVTTRTSGTILTIGSNCVSGATNPCITRIGSTVYTFTAGATATLGTLNGLAYIYISSAGVLTVGISSGSLTCSGCTLVTSVSAFPNGSIPLATWNATTNVWDATGTEQRAILSGGGNMIMVSGTGDPSGACVVGQSYYVNASASPKTLWMCETSGTWRQILTSNGTGAFQITGATQSTPSTPSAGNVTQFYDATAKVLASVGDAGVVGFNAKNKTCTSGDFVSDFTGGTFTCTTPSGTVTSSNGGANRIGVFSTATNIDGQNGSTNEFSWNGYGHRIGGYTAHLTNGNGNLDTCATTIALPDNLASYIKVELTGNCTATSTAVTGGSVTTVEICQDLIGGHSFAWPTEYITGMIVGVTAGKCSVQQFIGDSGAGKYKAIGVGVTDQ